MALIDLSGRRFPALRAPVPTPAHDAFMDVVKAQRSRAGLIGLVLIGVTFGGFGMWLAITPLNGAVVASGTVTVEGRRQTVQHPDGGTVTQILVQEGQEVHEGDLLFRLDDTAAQAEADTVRVRYDTARTLLARLNAERDEAAQVDWPGDLLSRALIDSDTAAIVRAQQNVFSTRTQSFRAQTKIYEQRIGLLQVEIEGSGKVLAAQRRQFEIVDEETKIYRKLYESGNGTRIKLLASEKIYADLQAQLASTEASIARLHTQVGETELALSRVRQERERDINDQIKEQQRLVSELAIQTGAARAVLARAQVHAPASGKVVGFNVFTVGGVVQKGERLMEVVPSGAELVVETKVAPDEADDIRPGMTARMHLLALRAEGMPLLEGTVTRVSADAMVDARTREAAFPVEISVPHDTTGAAGDLYARLYPGMPVRVQIATRERTALSYLLDPLLVRLNGAFRQE